MKPSIAVEKSLQESFVDRVLANDKLPPAILLLLLGLAVFSITLSIVPSNGDDLVLLSSVANTDNPLSYFVGGWGLGNDAYRPLHSVSLWVVYQLVDVSATPNQLINTVLHLLNTFLLFRLLSRLQSDTTIAFLLTSLVLFSVNTLSPVAWVSDRPTLLVAATLLLLLLHLLANNRSTQDVSLRYVSLLSVIALLSKESGVLVPLLAIFASFGHEEPRTNRIKMRMISIGILISYGVLRLAIFGDDVYSYDATGYVLNSIHYTNPSELSRPLQVLAHVENVVKNLIAPVLPIFGFEGQIEIGSFPWQMMAILPIPMLSLSLLAMSLGRRLNKPQGYALALIVLNAIIHHALFRHRTQYVAQIAFCIFIASSPLLTVSRVRRFMTTAVAFACLCFSIVFANRFLENMTLRRYEELNRNNLASVVSEFSTRIDKKIVQQVLHRYKQQPPWEHE